MNINKETVNDCIDEMCKDLDRIIAENRELKKVIMQVYNDLLSKSDLEVYDRFKIVTMLDGIIEKYKIDRGLL